MLNMWGKKILHQATPTDTGMCCSFNLKSGLKDGKYKWAPWLAFFIFNSNTNAKMGKSPSPASFNFFHQTDSGWPSKLFSTHHSQSGELLLWSLLWETLYRSHFWWPLGLALTRWFHKVWQNQSEKQGQQNCWQNCISGSHTCPWSSLTQSFCSYSGRRLQRWNALHLFWWS